MQRFAFRATDPADPRRWWRTTVVERDEERARAVALALLPPAYAPDNLVRETDHDASK